QAHLRSPCRGVRPAGVHARLDSSFHVDDGATGKAAVSKEQRDVWLGHDEKRTANAYEASDPDYLADCMRATESVIQKLQKHTRRSLFSCKLPASGGLRVIEGGRKSGVNR